MKMSGDDDHAQMQDECMQTGTSAPLKPAIGGTGLNDIIEHVV